MPIYTAPTFNLTAKVWSQELSQLSTEWNFQRPTRTPDLTPACQLYVQQRGGGFGVAIPYVRTSILLSQINVRIDLRLPAGTNVRYPLPNQPDGSGMFDVVEVPANSGRLYVIIFCIDIHAGFPNEYRAAVLVPYARIDCPEDLLIRYVDTLDILIGSAN